MAGHELGRRDFVTYRTGRTLYWDAAGEKVVTEPPSA
jgi:hypothetical protein